MLKCCKKKEKPVKDQQTQEKKAYPIQYLKLALSITGAFEGSGYSNIAGNFDGQGISVGILQWNYGQGSLQTKILIPLIETKGTAWIDSFFPEKISHTAEMSPKQAVKFAKKKMLKRGKLIDGWERAWRRFLKTDLCKGQQMVASDSVASKAWKYCEENSMKSAKSFCWFFDIVTQNGSLKGIEKPKDLSRYEDILEEDGGKNLKTWREVAQDAETQTLFLWTCERVIRNKWASDVISRKGTIAHGKGEVHGKYYDFTETFKQMS